MRQTGDGEGLERKHIAADWEMLQRSLSLSVARKGIQTVWGLYITKDIRFITATYCQQLQLRVEPNRISLVSCRPFDAVHLFSKTLLQIISK